MYEKFNELKREREVNWSVEREMLHILSYSVCQFFNGLMARYHTFECAWIAWIISSNKIENCLPVIEITHRLMQFPERKIIRIFVILYVCVSVYVCYRVRYFPTAE